MIQSKAQFVFLVFQVLDDKEAKLKEEYADIEKVIPKPYYRYILVRKLSKSDLKFLKRERKVR